jgi:hypothetical protein
MALRAIAAALALLAGAALLYDLVVPPQSGLLARSVGDWWFTLHSSSLNGLQAGIQRYLAPWLWDPIFVSFLQVPAWIVPAVLGALFWVLGRRRRA